MDCPSTHTHAFLSQCALVVCFWNLLLPFAALFLKKKNYCTRISCPFIDCFTFLYIFSFSNFFYVLKYISLITLRCAPLWNCVVCGFRFPLIVMFMVLAEVFVLGFVILRWIVNGNCVVFIKLIKASFLRPKTGLHRFFFFSFFFFFWVICFNLFNFLVSVTNILESGSSDTFLRLINGFS